MLSLKQYMVEYFKKDLKEESMIDKKPNEIDQGLDSGETLDGINVLRKPKVTLAHLTKALDHPSPHVRLQAIRHPKANFSHIQKALKDKHEWVKSEAKRLLQAK